jgi:FkbM family methyltransferase
MKAVYNTFHFIFHHPLTKDHKISAMKRYLSWQLMSRLFTYPLIYPFVEDSRLLVVKGMTGATGNIYTGLHEYGDMGFLLHLLRPGDLFGDIGANIGSYTILASAVAKSKSISIEPVSKTFLHLKHNIAVNNIESLVNLRHCGVGAENGKLFFTSTEDTINHVVTKKEGLEERIEEVDVLTLDEIFSEQTPVLLKVDVEGFEMSVLEGAAQTLSKPELKAIILELNGLCNRYGVQEDEIHKLLLSYGFATASYDPMDRKLELLPTYNKSGNTIYIRNEQWVRARLQEARKVKVLEHLI